MSIIANNGDPRYRGRFIDEASLLARIPVGRIGDVAIVLTPNTVWYAWNDLIDMWVNTGEEATVVWGTIGGTLSDQADLQAALDAKANTDDVVNSVQGTANQVLVNGTSGAQQVGDVILTLPQDIATTSNVSFLNGFFGSTSDLTTDTKKIDVVSNGFAQINIRGDNANTTGEVGGASLLLSNDAGFTAGILSKVQNAGGDGRGGSFTGSTANSIILGTLDSSGNVEIGVNRNVIATISASGISATNLSGTNTGDVTVLDSSEIDFTLTGQQITASLVAGSIDETKLDASVNASLDLADSALQSGDNVSELNNNAGYVNQAGARAALYGVYPIGYNITTGEFSWTASIPLYYNQSFTSQTSVVVSHDQGAYPLVQVLDASGVVLIPQSITHNSTNQFTVAFGASTTGTIIYFVGI